MTYQSLFFFVSRSTIFQTCRRLPFYLYTCTTQSLIRIKLLFLFAGYSVSLITKNLLQICSTTVNFINVITFVSVLCKFLSQSYNPPPPKICNCDCLLPCLDLSCIPSYWCISLHKRIYNRNAVSLKSKTDFLKIPEICDIWLKPLFFTQKSFFRKNYVLRTRSL